MRALARLMLAAVLLAGCGATSTSYAPEVVEARSPETVEPTAGAWGYPLAYLSSAGEEIEGYRFGGCWRGGCGDGIPPIEPDEWLEVDPDDELRFRFSRQPTDFTTSVGRHQFGADGKGVPELEQGNPTKVPELEPGEYQVGLHASWAEGDLYFSFPVRVL